MPTISFKILVTIGFMLSASTTFLFSQSTEIIFLSGTGPDDAVPWEFYCTEGRNSGQWTTIPVPSNWEFHGFGAYNYGFDKNKGKEEGWYRHRFQLPAAAKGKQVSIVFEGSMTDTWVKVNGKEVGPVHQGAFYRFQYDITPFVKAGKENLLEVRVAKQSLNFSVNQAEREADYWIFGGIYRPVYLAISPRHHLQRTAIDASADGSIRIRAFTTPVPRGMQVRAQVLNLNNQSIGEVFRAPINTGDTIVDVNGKVQHPMLWNAEQPHLYRVKIDLLDQSGNLAHTLTERFGFRTVDVRAGDGIFINGTKVILKGVNRHCTWPTTGKAITRQQSLQDALLIKEMNMNAVRMSHYPPDKHFLEICDSLGLYVLNELAGWQKAYDTLVGRRLVKELVTRDVNHPSIILWANGNEGGFNRALIPDYNLWDIQRREVYLPWERYGKFETKHYPDFNYLANSVLYEKAIFMPTEFMHGLYDGGHGAGLDDFWNTMMQKPNCAGGFLWVFADEGIIRTDLNDSMDAKDNRGADGIVGPFREKEGSFYTIRQIWSPVQIQPVVVTPGFDGRVLVQNRYHFTNLKECRFSWKLLYADGKTETRQLPAFSLDPGEQAWLPLQLPSSFAEADILYLSAMDPFGRELFTWSWPVMHPETLAARQYRAGLASETISTRYEGSLLKVQQGSVVLAFDTANGMLEEVKSNGKLLPFGHGPVLAQDSLQFSQFTVQQADTHCVIRVLYTGKSTLQLIWEFSPGYPVQLRYKYVQPFDTDVRGIHFRFPDSLVQSVDYLGMGPYRVWKNRMKGGQFGYWHKDYNNTVTGESWVYPEFKGFYASVYQTKFNTRAGNFSVYAGSEPYFLQLFRPKPPRGAYNNYNAPPFTAGDIGFLQGISPIGTKFQPAQAMGPQSQKNVMPNTSPLGNSARNQPNKLLSYSATEGSLWFDFR